MSGYSIGMDPEHVVYQHDDEVLRPVRWRDVVPARPFFLVPGGDDDHDQGDEPAELGPGWIELGYVEESGAAALRAEESARRGLAR